MANPNIVTVTSIIGKSTYANLTTTPTDIITNAVNSNTILKINHVTVTNFGNTSVAVTMNVIRGANTCPITRITVPTLSSIIILSKDNSLYLEESDKISMSAGSANTLSMFASYEIIS